MYNSDRIFLPSTFRRLMAHFIDAAIRGIFFLPVGIQAALHWLATGRTSVGVQLVFACWMLDLLFKTICLKYFRATPGKYLLGLRLVPDQKPQGSLLWSQAFIRVISDQLSIIFGWGLWSLAFFRYDRTHVSDWLAETRVVQLHGSSGLPQRRWLLGAFLVMYLSQAGWKSAHHFFNHLEFTNSGDVYWTPD